MQKVFIKDSLRISLFFLVHHKGGTMTYQNK